MSEETSPIVVTLKGGVGYDAPWLVIRGNTPDEVAAMLRNLGELPEATVEAANLFQGVNNAAPVLQNAPAQQEQANVSQGPWGQPSVRPVQNTPPAQQSGPAQHPAGESCGQCGSVLQYKEVTRKSDNRQFKFWACPNQRSKGDGHRSEFAD